MQAAPCLVFRGNFMVVHTFLGSYRHACVHKLLPGLYWMLSRTLWAIWAAACLSNWFPGGIPWVITAVTPMIVPVATSIDVSVRVHRRLPGLYWLLRRTLWHPNGGYLQLLARKNCRVIHYSNTYICTCSTLYGC